MKVVFRIWHIFILDKLLNSEPLLTPDMVSSVWHEVSVISLHWTTCSFSVLVISCSRSSTLFFKILHSFSKDSARFVWISPSCLDFRRVSFREEIYKLRACTKHLSFFVLLCFVQYRIDVLRCLPWAREVFGSPEDSGKPSTFPSLPRSLRKHIP